MNKRKKEKQVSHGANAFAVNKKDHEINEKTIAVIKSCYNDMEYTRVTLHTLHGTYTGS